MSTMQLAGGWVIRAEVDMIDITSFSPKPDKTWRYPDSHFHAHYYDEAGPDHYPTLIWVVDEEDWMDEDGEEYPGTGHYECKRCGDHVDPAMLPASTFHEYAPGMMHITVTAPDETQFPLTPEQFDPLRAMNEAERNVALREYEQLWLSTNRRT